MTSGSQRRTNDNGDPAAGAVPDKLRRRLVSAFIAFNLFAITCWCVPLQSPLLSRIRSGMLPYMRWIGLFQSWDMFAPNPSNLNNYVGALVKFRDGSSRLWNFPRMENLGYVDRYFKERYRKYANDNLRLDADSALWPDAARYIARVNNQPSNPPVQVSLIRYWSVIPPPGPYGEYTEGPWQQFVFYRYSVVPGDLP